MTMQPCRGAGQDRSLPHSHKERLLPPCEYIRGHPQAEVGERIFRDFLIYTCRTPGRSTDLRLSP